MTLLVVNSPILFSSINVNFRLLKATIEFLWWGGLHSHFHGQPNYSVEVVLSHGLRQYYLWIVERRVAWVPGQIWPQSFRV